MTSLLGMLLLLCGLGCVGYLVARAAPNQAGNYEERYVQNAAQDLDVLYVFLPADQVWRLSLACAAGTAMITFFILGRAPLLLKLVLALLGASGAFWIPRGVLKIMVLRRQREFLSQLADAIGMLANAFRSGLGAQKAVDMVGREMPAPVSQEFKVIGMDQQLGKSLDEALSRLATRMPLIEVGMFVVVMRLAQRTGGNVSEALTRVAQTIRNRFMIEQKVSALTSEARMQSIVLAALPFVVGGGFWLVAPDLMRPFILSSLGVVVLVIVFLLEAVGVYWLWRITKIRY